MAVGRFDTPAQAQFMNTYSPVPFQEIMQAGLAKQGQYNVGASGFEEAQAQAEQLKYISGSEDEKYITGTVLPTFQELADEFATQDFGDPTVIRALNKRIRGLDKQRISRIQQSEQAHQQYQQDIRKLGLQGKSASYLNQFDPSTFSSEYGIFNQTPQAAVDFGKEAASYFDQLRDTAIDYDPNTGQMVSGVSMDHVEQIAKGNLNEFMRTEAGRQAVISGQHQGDTRSEAEIAFDVLLSRGAEYVRKNIGFAPQHAIRQPSDELVRTTSPEHILEDQPFGKDFTKYGEASKLRNKNNEKIKELEKQIKVANKVATATSFAEAKKLTTQKESIEAQNFAADYFMDKLEGEYESAKGKSETDFNDDFLKEVFKNSDITEEHYDDLELAFEAFKNESKSTTSRSFGSIYNSVIGSDENKNPFKEFTFKQKTLLKNQAEQIKSSYKDYTSERTDYVKDGWKNLDKGISVSTSLLPVRDNNKILIPGTNKEVNSPMQVLENSLISQPQSTEWRQVTGEELSDKEKSKVVEDIETTIQDGGSFDFLSAGTFDPKSPFLNGVLKDVDGKTIDNYQAYIGNPSQQAAISQTFALIGDIENAIKWENPYYSTVTSQKFDKGVKPEFIDFKVFNKPILFEKKGDKYIIYDGQGLVKGETASTNSRDIENALYDIFEETTISIRRKMLAETQQ